MSYRVVARVKKIWFCNPKLVFDVVEDYEEWYDLSYGNGGGDWQKRTKVLLTADTAEVAETFASILNSTNCKEKD